MREFWREWLTSKDGLEAITSYRINGEQFFFPLCAKPTSPLELTISARGSATRRLR